MKRISERVRAHPILGAWALIWAVTAGLNFAAGHEAGGLAIGLSFFALAIIGAYAAHEIDVVDGARKAGLWVLVLAQLCVGQWAGWQTLGLALSKGAAGYESKAGGHNSAAEQLKAARDERAALGVQRPIASIAAERELECKKTSKTYADGKGPKCTALMAEEGRAKRALELDDKIPELVRQLAEGDQLTDPNAAYTVAMSFGSALGTLIHGKPVAASRDDVLFWFKVFMTAVLEFVGTCGPWLFGLRDKWAAPAAAPPSVTDLWDFGPPRLASIPLPAVAGQGSPDLSRHPGPGADGLNRPPEPASLRPQPAPRAAPPPPAPAPAPDRTEQMLDRVADRNVAKLMQTAFAPQAPDRPVDKQALNAVLDNLCAFTAACVSRQTGAVLSARDLYRRYEAWAGSRAVDALAFHTLYPAVVEDVHRQDVGGVPHYMGLALRQPQLIAS